MEIKQFYLACLSHASYLVGSGDECAIVDPQRDVQQYLDAAALRGMRIRYVIETHLHADFVSGHPELAAITGAEIVFGRRAGAELDHLAVSDGDELRVGGISLRILETPGHTPESICIIVHDESGAPKAVLTGDTLFIGDVGRPDLVAAAGHSPQDMAAQLHDSLHRKLLSLPDDVEVYPAHGAGSLCGRNMSKELSSTIGAQRRTNLMLAPMAKDEFVALMTSDLPEQPAYFAMDVRMNRSGPAPIASLPDLPELSPDETAALQAAGASVLDVRTPGEFAAGHVPGSVNIGLSGQFASWAGTLLPLDRDLVIVAAGRDQAVEARLRLARVGLSARGALGGGVGAWAASGRPVASTPRIHPADLALELSRPDPPLVLDVRRPGEHAAGHVPGAVNVPLHRLRVDGASLDRSRSLRVVCQSGYRSAAAVGILESLGFGDVADVAGGTAAWIDAGHDATAAAGAGCRI